VYDAEPCCVRAAEDKKKGETVMRRSIFPLALVAWLVAGLAVAELSQALKDWPNGPAGFLLTDKERKEYQSVKTDAEAQAWIDLFWARRDPDLNTVPNELKLAFDQRVEVANKNFSTEKVKGCLSDRGKVLILLGAPTEVKPEPVYSNDEGMTPGARMSFAYVRAALPEKLRKEVKGEAIKFMFQETRPGLKDFPFARPDRNNTDSLKILAMVPDTLLVNPKLTEVPRMGLLAGSKAATKAQLELLDAAPRPWPESAKVFVTTGVQTEVLHAIWAHIQLPDSVPPATQVVGRVKRATDGQEMGTFAVGIKALSVPNARAYELAVPTEAGDFKLEIALLGETGDHLAVTTIDAKNESTPSEGTYFTPFYWGSDIRQETQAHLGDPFNIGGWHVIPRTENRYTVDDTLSYFCYIVRPGIDEQTKLPKLETSLALFQNDKKVDETPFEAISAGKVWGDIWMFGRQIPLSGFRKGSELQLEVTLRDTLTKATRTTRFPVNMAKDAAAPAAAAPAPAATASPAKP
jgi:GWxTD domain-containing protein